MPPRRPRSCYGTLAKYVKLGHDVAVCHIANGNLGHAIIMQKELAEIRLAEAQAAAKAIGAAHCTVGANDLYVTAEDDDLVERLSRVIRDVQPELIITHNDQEYMNDHMQAYYATLRASFGACIPHFDMGSHAPVAGVCPIYHMDTVAGTGFIPTEYVDVSDTIELKLEALACHKSQVQWMLDHDHIDFLDFVRCCSCVRGFQCGVAHAVGFRPNHNYLRMSAKRLLP